MIRDKANQKLNEMKRYIFNVRPTTSRASYRSTEEFETYHYRTFASVSSDSEDAESVEGDIRMENAANTVAEEFARKSVYFKAVKDTHKQLSPGRNLHLISGLI